MVHTETDTVGRFCWVDLAASDAEKAKAFYGALFGWTSQGHKSNGGVFTCLRSQGADVGSLYQLKQSHLDRGVPSHWTPYVRVSDIEETVARAVSLGGEVIIPPFVVTGVARIALILDSVGALLGLWQPVEMRIPENAHDD